METQSRSDVNETILTFTPLAEEQDVQLVQQLDPLPELHVDPARIRQVLHNLLANAIRHTPSGGRVTLAGRVDGALVELAVRDTGGIGLGQHVCTALADPRK